MRSSETTVAVLSRDTDDRPYAATAQLVPIVAISDDGAPLVLLDADGPPIPARLAVRTTTERVQLAIASCQPAVVVFEGGDPARPLIVGLLEQLGMPPESPAPSGASRHADTSLAGDAPAANPDAPSALPILEADVDGRRVRLTASDEIVLQCGSASVTLRRNGRVVIRGAYVETNAEGTNRIKGGQVQIN